MAAPARGCVAAAVSTSRATMRPCGPDGVMRPRSMPASLASRRASGVTALPPIAGRTEIALGRAHLEERIERAAGGPCGRQAGRAAGAAAAAAARRFALAPGAGAADLRLGRRAVARNHCNHGADRRHLAHADADFRERAGGGRRHLHRHLVGLDLEQVVARLHGVAGRLEPLRDLALSHGLAELRHQHVHQQFLTSCVPNTLNNSCRPY